MAQEIIPAKGGYKELGKYLLKNGIRKVLLVCGRQVKQLGICRYLYDLEKRIGIQVVEFNDFSPNPSYESVVNGVRTFQEHFCDSIIAVGGGSAMDVAKCIKLFSNMAPKKNYLMQEIVPNALKFIAVPTTAGTGSEATRYAVIYYEGEKQSVTHESCIPTAVLLDPSVLTTLPEYQRKSTMLDALCHSLESYWSVNSTETSRGYSQKALEDIMLNMDAYLRNEEVGNRGMLKAANTAGKAINITQTTAGHAMCYKLTGLYGISHGHAAALCILVLWPYMAEHLERCIDPRGPKYLQKIFEEIAKTMGCSTVKGAISRFQEIYRYLSLDIPKANQEDIPVLIEGINLVRLKNNPIVLDEEAIRVMYLQMLKIDTPGL